ncbi:MAG: glutamyl-tRNA(Gln) amidotransferase, A subunit, partial [uncultured bacterium]
MRKLHELTIEEVHEGYAKREFTCVDLVKHFLNRIEKYNPKLNVYLSVNENALEDAARVDEEIREKGIHRPLLGIPFAVKDNFLTVGITTTASSNILKGYLPQYESTTTQRILS